MPYRSKTTPEIIDHPGIPPADLHVYTLNLLNRGERVVIQDFYTREVVLVFNEKALDAYMLKRKGMYGVVVDDAERERWLLLVAACLTSVGWVYCCWTAVWLYGRL